MKQKGACDFCARTRRWVHPESRGYNGAAVKQRFPFLDWMRGLAILVMIQCHTFNSLVRLDLRNGGPYIISQFVGGMAAPLFLFMAGMTFGFQRDSLDRRVPDRWGRLRGALKRSAYIMGIAFAFRTSNYIASIPHPQLEEIFRVDILNSMALAMFFFAFAAAFDWSGRMRFAVGGALAIAAVSPIVGSWNWAGVPQIVTDYLAPGVDRGRFPFFPTASYIGFGLAAGMLVKRAADGMDRLMQWTALAGLGLIVVAEYFSNVPYSLYGNLSDFWRNSPGLILIRAGVSMALLVAAYVWTEYAAGRGWSWMQTLGKNSLMVYWVHIMLVYGNIAKPIKRTLSIPAAAFAVIVVTAAMVALSEAWMRYKARRAANAAPKPPKETYATGTLAARTD